MMMRNKKIFFLNALCTEFLFIINLRASNVIAFQPGQLKHTIIAAETYNRCYSTSSILREQQQQHDGGNNNDDVTVTAFVQNIFGREQGQMVMDEKLMPAKEYGNRIGLGRDAIGVGESSVAISPNDPRLTMTYAEFPLPSLDQLIDLAMAYLPKKNHQSPETTTATTTTATTTLVDIGSGCGRLVFYLALTRGSSMERWDIHGIEISKLLHDVAVSYVDRGMQKEENHLFSPIKGTTTGDTSFSLHYGPVNQYPNILHQADMIFAYSTAFPAPSFSPELGAMILDPEWSATLSHCCKPGCVAVTTDRALDPSYGWELVDRLDVENPELLGSTGFIHILKR